MAPSLYNANTEDQRREAAKGLCVSSEYNTQPLLKVYVTCPVVSKTRSLRRSLGVNEGLSLERCGPRNLMILTSTTGWAGLE